MPVHYSERLRNGLLQIARRNSHKVHETPFEESISHLAQLRVRIAAYLDGYSQQSLQRIDLITMFAADTSQRFFGITVGTPSGDEIALASTDSKLYEHGVSLLGSTIRRENDGAIELVQQQWLLGYTRHMTLEMWYAGPRFRWFAQITDGEQMNALVKPLEQLFTSGVNLKQLSTEQSAL